MRPLLPFTTPRGDGPHRVEVAGELRVVTGSGSSRVEPFGCRTTIEPGTGSMPILVVRSASATDVVDLEIQGSVQHDGSLMVTCVIRLRHGPGPEGDELDAETTVVPVGASPGFQVTSAHDDGCRASATGSITHGPGRAHEGR